MKILVLTHEFPPVGGGGGRVAQDIAVGMAARGHEMRVLTAFMDGLPKFEVVAGVRVERIAPKRRAAFRAEFGEMANFNWAAFRAGRRLIREWKPDLIHAHFAVPAGAAAYALGRLTGIPYILTAHLGDVPGAVPEKTDRWFKWIFPFTPPIWHGATRVAAVSEFTRKMALRHYTVPMDVIPNGVDLHALPTRLPNSERLPGDPIRIVFAGRFMEQKNPGDLVRALKRLPHLSWRCAMLGDGPLLDEVRQAVQGSGLAERFSLPGWVSPQKVLDEFAHSDLLVLPSRSEGLSVVGVQALGVGLAMVLSDAGGNLELVSDGENGFIFPAGDVPALAERLERLLVSPFMLQSAQKKSRAMAQKFDLAAIVLQYETLFNDILSSRLIQKSAADI
jgi:glycosyltransferase involved in cell wall biosynthesis